MVTATLLRHEEPTLVRAKGASMYGISGHKVADLEPNAEVTIYGEHGPYTIVSCQGRNGYVLTEQLALASELEEEAREAAAVIAEPVQQTPQSGTGARVILLLLATAGAAGGALAVFGIV